MNDTGGTVGWCWCGARKEHGQWVTDHDHVDHALKAAERQDESQP